MKKSVNLLKLCEGLQNKDKKSQLFFLNNVPHDTLHQICEIYFNIQWKLNDKNNKVPLKLRREVMCALRKGKNGKECKYISNRQNDIETKRKYLKKQVGSGLFTALISAATPIISSIISAVSAKK